MSRDTDVLRFNAEQTFVRFDSFGEYLAPGHTPALAEPPASQLADTSPPAKRAWPADSRHRLMAVSRLMRKLEKRGLVDIIQPWADQPAWSRVTATGLHFLGLDWPETLWPETPQDIEDRLRHDREWKSHNHLVNQVRLLLMRGGAGMPEGKWKGERDIEAALPERAKGYRRPHKADGLFYLLKEGSWSVMNTDGTRVVYTTSMQSGQLVAIEVECSRKSRPRLQDILPDLIEHHDFVWYFCLDEEVQRAVSDARKLFLETNTDRRRVRVLKLKEYLRCL